MPSKKVISIFIICSALVLAIIIISPRSTNQSSIKNVIGITGDSPQIDVVDNPNWQEDVSGISKGVSLLEEATTTDETFTDTFSRSFMANYLELKKNGSYNNTSANDLITKSLDFVNKTSIQQFEMEDIIVTPDNSKPALTKYGNDLGYALKINKPIDGTKNEMEVLARMLQTMDPQFKEDLLNISKIYGDLATSISKIIVPSKFATRHLSRINALKEISIAVADLSNTMEDPVKSIQAINIYEKSFAVLVEESRLIKVEMVKAGVSYKQGENGYYFFFGI